MARHPSVVLEHRSLPGSRVQAGGSDTTAADLPLRRDSFRRPATSRPAPCRLRRTEERLHRDIERVRQARERVDRDVLAALDLRDPLVGDAKLGGDLYLRHPLLTTKLCDPSSDVLREAIRVVPHWRDRPAVRARAK